MIRLLFTFATFFCCMVCFSQRYYFFNDSLVNSKKVLLLNHISKQTLYTYKMNDGKIIDSTLNFTERYNSRGNITERCLYMTSGTVLVIDSFFYDAGQRLTRHTAASKRGDFISQTGFVYDDQDNETEMVLKTILNGNIINYVAKKEYNAKGQVTEKYESSGRGNKITLAERYFYNKEGELEKKTAFDTTGRRTADYLYETKKRRKLVITQNANGTGNTIEFFYNKREQCTKIEWHLGKRPILYHFSYNADGTMFEYTTTRNNGQKVIERYYYEKE